MTLIYQISKHYEDVFKRREPAESANSAPLAESLLGECIKLDVDPRRDDDASPMSSYRCMLRPTRMFMDRMIAPINVHSIS